MKLKLETVRQISIFWLAIILGLTVVVEGIGGGYWWGIWFILLLLLLTFMSAFGSSD